MKWFGSQVQHPPETRKEQQAESTVQTSLALNVLYHQFRQDRKYDILDLGPPLGKNVDFFGEFSVKLYIENFFETLSSFDYLSPEDGISYRAVFEYLLPFPSHIRFDLILSWDLFNYLEREEFKHLIQHLSRFCHRGSMIFALISTKHHIPEKPTTFRIVDSHNLHYQINSSVLRTCPRYEQTDLNSFMPHFRVCNSFLLRNGFKEYLFLYE